MNANGQRAPLHILIVEDNPDDVLIFRRMLKQKWDKSNRISEASTGEDALEMLSKQTVDCILLDYRLPDMDGLEFLAELNSRKEGDLFPVILLTGQGDEHVAVRAMKSGAADYLVKGDLTSDWLARTISHAIDQIHSRQERQRHYAQLEKAYRQIIAQQKSVIEEERLKVLLQMAGTTAHELNQPLMALLGSIETIRGRTTIDPESLDRIDTAGRRIAEIVQRIQDIRHDQITPYAGSGAIVKINQPVTVLAVEDDKADMALLQHLVEEIGNIILEHAGSQKEALEWLQSKSFDLILLDYQLPDGTGLEFLEVLKQKWLEIPVVIVTGMGDEVLASQSIQSGAYDYLPKAQLSQASLTRTITNTLEKSRFQRDLNLMTKKLAQMATRDELTGLFNRRYFNECLQNEIQRTQRYKRNMSLSIFDLDHFKRINDTYGHLAGDHVLKEVGKLVLEATRQTDIACRYGGEEIAVIMPQTDLEQSALVCERIREGVGQLSFRHNGDYIHVTISAGVALYDPCAQKTADAFVDKVDQLLYQAKVAGRDRVVGFGEKKKSVRFGR
jgi:two-component system cell cycle response regulator